MDQTDRYTLFSFDLPSVIIEKRAKKFKDGILKTGLLPFVVK